MTEAKDRTLIMGILNVTPDSFSDGGLFLDKEKAVQRAEEMLREGADIIDIGGESTRPGSDSVSLDEELSRVLPVIHRIREKLGKEVTISIDTNKSKVAEAALSAGANMVNSLGGFLFDPGLVEVVHQYECQIVIYHIRGEPKSMQQGEIQYQDVIGDIKQFFNEQIGAGLAQGLRRDQFLLDPGIGFGKTLEQNLEIIRRLGEFSDLNLPIVVGVSRKNHLGKILQDSLGLESLPEPTERVEAGLAEVAVSVLNGAGIIRTHDVSVTRKFLAGLDKFRN